MKNMKSTPQKQTTTKRIPFKHQSQNSMSIVKKPNLENPIFPFPRKRQTGLHTEKRSLDSKNISKILNGDLKNPFSKSKQLNTIEIIHTEKEYTILSTLTQEIEYSYKEDQNKNYKETMEDKGKSILNFNEKQNNILFALFDGHGGDFVSKYLQEYFDKYFKKNITNLTQNEIEKSFKKTFLEIDNSIKEKSLNVGSTGTILLITQDNNKKIIYGANIGDTRCTLFNEKNIERLTFEHRVEDSKEKERIINSGGILKEGRVNGTLMLSRVFGDFELKKVGVKCDPYLFKKEINSDIKNQFLILASDGIWDIIDEWEIKHYISDICSENEGTGQSITKLICDKLVNESMHGGGWDNISVFTIKLT
jgi:serine/threonine protein phosphatase PrpC